MKYLYVLVFTLPMWAMGAPHPATSSSFLVGKDVGRFISQYGFIIHSANTGWVHKRPPKGIDSIETVYISPNQTSPLQASLTVRVDQVKKKESLISYIQRWTKDYYRFGFQVLSSQRVKVGENYAHMVDLVHPDSNKQLRQVMFLKNRRIVIFTCRDQKNQFRGTLKSCNEIVRSFRWTI